MLRRIVSTLVGISLFAVAAANAQAAPSKRSTAEGKSASKTVKAARAAKPPKVAQKQKSIKIASLRAQRASAVEVPAASSDWNSLALQSSAYLVQDQATGAVLMEKNGTSVQPIASITKLMTAMVTLDAKLGLDEVLTISNDDLDTVKGTGSRLRIGTQLTREEMLRLALMSSENRAASALGRNYPGGKAAFIAAMNNKSEELGLKDTRFADSTGLTSANVSSPRDLARMVDAAHQYPLIREFSTTPNDEVAVAGRTMQFNNTNSLVKSPNWEIGLSKTGYISEAGKCLVMQAWFNNKPVIIVLLDSWGKMTRIGDANRIKRWIEHASLPGHNTSG